MVKAWVHKGINLHPAHLQPYQRASASEVKVILAGVFFELVVGSVMAMQAADSGCLLSIRASLKANNSRPVQAIYFISVCETTSRRDSTRLITLNQHCPHFIRSSYYMTAWVLIQPTRRDSIQHDSYRTDSSREHWPILEIKFNI